MNNIKTILMVFNVFLLMAFNNLEAQVPDPNLGLRADWMRGSWGVNWKPENFYGGVIEDVSIEPYLENIRDIRTIDYVQVHLTESNIYSPSHSAPNTLLESLWEGDTNVEGKPINLIVPRASSGSDPFLNWLEAIKAAGLKTMVYVNSYNLLARDESRISDDFPNVSERWENYCDSDLNVQTFIHSKSYHVDGIHSRRPYMFCYAEFVLKEYAIRYGDLIDAWAFDAADNIMEEECGDNPASEDINDQRIYGAFANAVHAGNPNAAIAFNNSVGTAAAPFVTPTYFDDYCFGHPFGGAGNMVETTSLYNRNFGICEFMQNTDGHPFTSDTRAWNDNVVGRFFPKLSTTAWNAGNTPCLSDAQFVEWNLEGIMNAGSILWGAPLVRTNLLNSPVLTMQPYALTQLALTDTYFKEFQFPGAPNWARQHTILPNATIGQLYNHTLVEDFDFWDPEGDAITSLIALDNFPTWLNITETESGVWTLSGTPNESAETAYEFNLEVSDASGGSSRLVGMNVETSSLSIQDINQDNSHALTLFPNPTSNMVSLNITPQSIAVFDISGKRIKKDQSGATSLNLSTLNQGLYIFKIHTMDGKVFFKKLIKI